MRMSSLVLCALVVGAASVAAAAPCLYGGHEFSESAVSCQNGRQFRCSSGRWEAVGTECSDEDPVDGNVQVKPGVTEPAVREPAIRERAVQQPTAPNEPRVP
jgi:hypothetical protein